MTVELIKYMIDVNSKYLIYIPKEKLTLEMCEYIMKKDKLNLMYIPIELQIKYELNKYV